GGEGDVTVVSGLWPVRDPSCAAVLVPAINAGDPQAATLRDGAVSAVLAAIGLGTGGGPAWMTTDGRWANGVLAGSWHKDTAGYIGEGAREAARRARIASLTGELGEVRAAIAAIDGALGDLENRRERLPARTPAAPAGAPGPQAPHR